MQYCVTVGQVLRCICITARVTDHKRLMHKEANVAVSIGSIYDVDITHKRTNNCVDCVVKLQKDLQVIVACQCVADESGVRVGKRKRPVRVFIEPTYMTVDIHAYSVAQVTTSRMVLKTYVWEVEVMNQTVFVKPDMKLAVTEDYRPSH
jgi:hypothetical protein